MRLLFFILLLASAAARDVIPGKVVGVHDGDTLTLLTVTKQQIRVRLHGIDAPELTQAFGATAKTALSDLVFSKQVDVQVIERDRYGRTVGRVKVGKTDVNLEMVRQGFAWWYRDYAKKDTALAAAETEAKQAKRGLWADASAQPPWEYRRSAEKKKAAATLRRLFRLDAVHGACAESDPTVLRVKPAVV